MRGALSAREPALPPERSPKIVARLRQGMHGKHCGLPRTASPIIGPLSEPLKTPAPAFLSVCLAG